MTVVPTSSEHEHFLKQELSYQPKFHQLMCYHLKQPSSTLICIYTIDAGSHFVAEVQCYCIANIVRKHKTFV